VKKFARDEDKSDCGAFSCRGLPLLTVSLCVVVGVIVGISSVARFLAQGARNHSHRS
jgi:hypothetical protein